MPSIRCFTLSAFAARLIAGMCAVSAFSAQPVEASPFVLIYTGTFNTQEALNPASAPTANFTATTPFTVRAMFDDSTPNLAPALPGPFAGFRAYAPSLVTIEIAGVLFGIETNLSNPTAGVTVAIFDQNSFEPGRYGVGLIADPVADGAGFVGDFVSASPNFTVDALTPTTFTDYFGVGHSSGVCSSGFPPACPHVVTPFVLRDSNNVAWNLTLGNYAEDYPIAHTADATVGALNSAQIVAGAPVPVPEPATGAVMLAGFAGLALFKRIRR
jgi:hypothetical protein